jgi:hypothetical protein
MQGGYCMVIRIPHIFIELIMGGNEKNTVHSLVDNGVLIEGTKDLIDHATSYYKELFGPAPGNLFSISPSIWSNVEKLNTDDNDNLTRPFTEEEVKNTLFSMDTNRAPGMDEIPIVFYQLTRV